MLVIEALMITLMMMMNDDDSAHIEYKRSTNLPEGVLVMLESGSRRSTPSSAELCPWEPPPSSREHQRGRD